MYLSLYNMIQQQYIIQTLLYRYIPTFQQNWIHTHRCTYIHACLHTFIPTSIQTDRLTDRHGHVRTRTHIHTHTQLLAVEDL